MKDLEAVGFIKSNESDHRFHLSPYGTSLIPRLLILDPSVHRSILLSSDSFSCSLGPAMKEAAKELADILPAK